MRYAHLLSPPGAVPPLVNPEADEYLDMVENPHPDEHIAVQQSPSRDFAEFGLPSLPPDLEVPDAEMHAINFMLHSKDVDEKKGHWLLAADAKPGTTRIAGGGACAVGYASA